MDEHTSVQEQFAVIAATERVVAPLRVLKAGDTFAVFDQRGDILAAQAGEGGLYSSGTRFLSCWELFLYKARPLFLSSTVTDDNTLFVADLTNTDIYDGEHVAVAHGEIHVSRARVLSEGSCSDRYRITSYARHPLTMPLTLRFDSDFADVFEVRGTRRARRGERLPDVRTGRAYALRYRGLDAVERGSRLQFSHQPDVLDDRLATFFVRLEPHATHELDVSITYEPGEGGGDGSSDFEIALARARATSMRHAQNGCVIESSHPALSRWIKRSTSDLHVMLTDTPFGTYPYAGIPWFSTPFGRDGIITAFELLWADPSLARGVLTFLATTQATTYDDANDAQPGKIVHELRSGEMAALREVPFGRYYGTADATPLFVALAYAYYERTADAAFIDALWPHLEAALDWICTGGDPDGDGFVEYTRRSPTGLIQQGWKDSHDSVFHADGTLAEPPIALCEIQGYAYAAWMGASRLATMRGDTTRADEWRSRAERLRADFDVAFWCEELGTYALALDGDKRPCRVRTSNPGHCLFTGIASADRAKRVAATLMDGQSFSGWGVRTLARGQARYNPMSYHNGSVWPHDNALVAAGLARYDLIAAATRILESLLDLSAAVDLHRLPELICGFDRQSVEYPTLYPVACAPQAWAAGAVYLLLQSCLGLRIDGAAQRVSFVRGMLPQGVDWLRITKLRVGEATVDLLLERHPHDVGLTVLQRDGAVEVIVVK